MNSICITCFRASEVLAGRPATTLEVVGFLLIAIFISVLAVIGIVHTIQMRRAGTSKNPLEAFTKKQQQEKEERKEKIVTALQERGKITNDEVEELLGVSDATATRYFDELEQEGKIEQIGREGRSVHYKLKK
jgi:DNA-binding transcriptional ArsR family regulator